MKPRFSHRQRPAAVVCNLLLIAGCAWSACASVGRAQLAAGLGGEGISVYGTGEVSARPNIVEIDLQVSGKAELTGDALVKYRDAKKRVLDALEKLKIDNMTTSEHGLSITVGGTLEQQQRMMNGMMQAPGKPQVDVSSVVRLTLKNVRDAVPEELIKTIGRLMDVAQDSGVNVGPNAAELMRAMRFGQQMQNAAPVRFVLTDLAELREKAYENAVADARHRATRLAKLHQVKLGPALSIQEILVGGDHSASTNVQNFQGYQQPIAATGESNEPRIVSSSLAGVPVPVKLLVRFAIAPADPATAQK